MCKYTWINLLVYTKTVWIYIEYIPISTLFFSVSSLFVLGNDELLLLLLVEVLVFFLVVDLLVIAASGLVEFNLVVDAMVEVTWSFFLEFDFLSKDGCFSTLSEDT